MRVEEFCRPIRRSSHNVRHSQEHADRFARGIRCRRGRASSEFPAGKHPWPRSQIRYRPCLRALSASPVFPFALLTWMAPRSWRSFRRAASPNISMSSSSRVRRSNRRSSTISPAEVSCPATQRSSGGTGTGKTHLVIAIARSYIHGGARAARRNLRRRSRSRRRS